MVFRPEKRKMKRQKSGQFFVIALIVILSGIPLAVRAAVSMEADQMCLAFWDYGCPCGMVCKKGGPPGGQGCPCGEAPPGGKVTGVCVQATNCKGTGTEAGGIGDLKGMLDLLKGVMDMLKKKEDGGGGGGGGGDGTGGQFGTTTCRSYYQVSVPSSDPCAYYVPPVSTLFNENASGTNSSASLELLNALNVGIDSAFGVEPVVDNATDTTTGVSGTSTPGPSLSEQAVDVGAGKSRDGAFGDIVTTEIGGTIYANSRDAANNVEVSGFFGADSFVGKMQGAVGNMCKTRPWDGSLLSRVIPASFFDGLCSWRGYQVGTPAPPPPPPAASQPAPKSKTAATSSSYSVPQTPAGEPKVDIWAVPGSVSLGLRASIFWSTKNVDSCAVSSSGANFNESKLSGGAATVPLTSDTTFTISCVAPGSKTLTDEVTVTISP